MFCTNCGHAVAEDMTFCPNCGTAMANEKPPQPDATVRSPYARPKGEQETPGQPTTEFVWPAFMEIPVEAEYKQPPEKEPAKPRSKKKLWLSVCAVVLILATIATVVLLTAKKTVYLQTVSESEQSGITTRYSYAYDPEGRIVKFTFESDSSLSIAIATTNPEIAIYYFYDQDGNLKTAEIHYSQYSQQIIQVEYVYEKGVLTDFTLSTERETVPLDVRCDKKGRIEYVGVLDDNGEEQGGWEFSYYGHGGLSRCTLREGEYRTIDRHYDRAGRMTMMETHYNGNLEYKLVWEYDDRGNLTQQTTYTEEERETTLKMAYTYEKGRIVDMQIQSGISDGSDVIGAQFDFECQWDGNVCEMIIESVDGDGELLGVSGEELEDFCILLEKDKKGNTLYYEVLAGDEELLSIENEYEAYKLPWYYETIYAQTDPLYMYFVLDGF